MAKKIMTKEEFRERWDSNPDGDDITLDEVAECAKEWGLFEKPRTLPVWKVVDAVCEAAGCTT